MAKNKVSKAEKKRIRLKKQLALLPKPPQKVKSQQPPNTPAYSVSSQPQTSVQTAYQFTGITKPAPRPAAPQTITVSAESKPQPQGNATKILAEAEALMSDAKNTENAEQLAQAVQKYSEAAELGLPEAQYRFGLCCLNGEGISAQPKNAASYFRSAAKSGFIPAQLQFADCFLKGIGVVKNPTRAAYWYRKAAEQNNAEAQYKLGLCYLTGVGVLKNESKAENWFSKAAEQGHKKALQALKNK